MAIQIEWDFSEREDAVPKMNKNKNADDGYCCPHCHRLVKRYRRSLNCSMALTLIYLYKSGKRDWVHVEKFLAENGYPRSGDFHKLVLFGLLDKMVGEREDGSQRNGYYRLNGKSLLFVEGKLTVPAKAVILNGTFEGFEGENIDIKKALGEKFNYNELMGY